MKRLFNKLIDFNKSALLICLIGIATQVITYPFLFIFGVTFHLNEQLMMIFGVLSVMWFFIPLISIVAIIIAIRQIYKHIGSRWSVVGLVVNLIWLILFLAVACLVLIFGISV